jgi:hypothetical protein
MQGIRRLLLIPKAVLFYAVMQKLGVFANLVEQRMRPQWRFVVFGTFVIPVYMDSLLMQHSEKM